MKVPRVLVSFRSLIVCLFACAWAQAATHYVQTSPNRWSGNGSAANPFGSLEFAVQRANPGDFIYLKGGTHYPTRDEVFYNKQGTAEAPITIQSEPGQWAVLDFSNIPEGRSGIVFGTGSGHIHVKWLEVKNTKAIGIGIYSSHNVVEGCNVQHIRKDGIHVQGSYNRISYNTIWKTNLYNRAPNGTTAGNVIWNAGIDIFNASHILVDNNYVHSNHGEGILFQRSNNITVRDNIAHDNYSTNYYIDNSQDSQVFNNRSYSNWYPEFLRSGNPANGIMVSIENTQVGPNLRNIQIYGNTISQANYGIYYWKYVTSGMQQCVIRDNVVWDAVNALIKIDADTHSGTLVHGNTFVTSWSPAILFPPTISHYSNVVTSGTP